MIEVKGTVVLDVCEKVVDTVSPHTCRHRVSGCELTHGSGLMEMLIWLEDIMVLVKQWSIES